MASKLIQAGENFIQAGQALDNFWYITEGSIEAYFPGGSVTLNKGDIIGICDFNQDSHFLSYKAIVDSKVIPYGSPAVLIRTGFFAEHADNMMYVAHTMNRFMRGLLQKYASEYADCLELYRFLTESYKNYQNLCAELHMVVKGIPGFNTLEAVEESFAPAEWQTSFYAGLQTFFSDKAMVPMIQNIRFVPGYFYHAAEDVHTLLQKLQSLSDYAAEISHLLLNEERLDLFDLYTELYYRIGIQLPKDDPKSVMITDTIDSVCTHVKNQPAISQALIESRMQEYYNRLESIKKLSENLTADTEQADFKADYSLPGKLADSLGIILDYADCMDEVNSSFKNSLAAYKQLQDKNAIAPGPTRLRENLARCFYQIYASAFQVSLMDDNIPVILKMFFNFGYVDAELCGMENACYLYQIAQTYHGLPERGIYTAYEWLRAIYEGKKEPSIDEFEADFEKHIQSMKAEGRISAGVAERMLKDRSQKVMFELNNMFPRANKITSGRPAAFSPLLSEHHFIRQPEDALLYADQITQTLDFIRNVDFTVFTRESITVLSKKENIHDFFHVEILPDIILMPVVGTRGVMWQEIVGRNRLTPARMMLPVFQLENLQKVMIRMIGEYRWEMCKRTQGARWNDVTYPSLTSLYYDYLQFYRKNNDLSADAKEKIRAGLQKCKQNFKEYYLSDYMEYILFESKASPHLNKMSRSILFSQCPFPEAIRQLLSSNPIYRELLDAYSRNTAERLKKLNNLCKKLITKKCPVPESMKAEIEFTQK